MGYEYLWVEGHDPGWGPHAALNRAPGGASRAPGGGLTPKCCVPTWGLTREAPGVPEGGGPGGYKFADKSEMKRVSRDV